MSHTVPKLSATGMNTFFFNHLSGCCCMWKAIFAPRYLGAVVEVVKVQVLSISAKYSPNLRIKINLLSSDDFLLTLKMHFSQKILLKVKKSL